MVQAMAETVAQVNRSRAFQPPGTVPPFVVRFDTGTLPVGYIVLSSETKTIEEIQEQAYIRVRPALVSLPGVSAPPPFGGNQRTIVVHVNPDRLRAYRLSPNDVIAALTTGNTIIPSGNARIADQMPIVPVNAMVARPKELENIPIQAGKNVYLRDLGFVEDGTDIRVSFALVNGRRAVYMMVSKRADASTLGVVNQIRTHLPEMKKSLPEDIDVSFQFDQSPYVTRAMTGVVTEGLVGAVLTGLMVLVFLRDWRSVVVVVLNIPFALLGSVVGLWLTGQTLNLMTLGGLALAVGILVDESTVEVENIHTQMQRARSVAEAVWLGNKETAVPRLLAMLCILAVFIPSFFMEGAARNLFVPMSLAVGFSMVTSYTLSSTFVPVMSVWLLNHHEHDAHEATGPFSFGRFRRVYAAALTRVLGFRWWLVAGYVLVAAVLVGLAGSQCGTEIFPKVDSGQFQLRLRAATGTRIEVTEQIAQKALEIIKEEAGPDNVEISVCFGGVSPSSYTINTIYLWTAGPEEVVMRVGLKEGSGIGIEAFKEKLRAEIPRQIGPWLTERLRKIGVPEAELAKRVDDLRLSFEPADIINEVMCFGSRTPIEVAISGPKYENSRAYAARVREQLKKIDTLRDLQVVQAQDYPTINVQVDRERAGQSDVTPDNVAKAMVAATSSSRFVVPNFWVDPTIGVGYQVQVEIPPDRIDSVNAVGMVTVKQTEKGQILLRDVAQVSKNAMPGEYDRYNMRRVVSMTANIEGEDLGRVARKIRKALQDTGEAPRGVTVDVRGQIVPMEQIFSGLSVGLVLAVVVIFLLLAAYFQSLRLAFVAVTTVPAVIAGVLTGLYVTGTTINIQSFMGAIMAIGVAVANAILLVTFAEKGRLAGLSSLDAAIAAAQGRLRPILMTSFAMIAGMIPMALALGEGGEQTAPLGRAVIGGLVGATLTTLTILPAIFALVQNGASTASVSLYLRDPHSPYYLPNAGQSAESSPNADESASRDAIH